MKRRRNKKKIRSGETSPRDKKTEILTIVVIVIVTLFGLVSAYLMFRETD